MVGFATREERGTRSPRVAGFEPADWNPASQGLWVPFSSPVAKPTIFSSGLQAKTERARERERVRGRGEEERGGGRGGGRGRGRERPPMAVAYGVTSRNFTVRIPNLIRNKMLNFQYYEHNLDVHVFLNVQFER